MELLVTLAILSILASAAVPFAEMTVRRERELELRQALREIRGAIDRFHDDWKLGRIPRTADGVSDDGYPNSLQVLVDGVDNARANAGRIRYLRRIPRDPLADRSKPPIDQWVGRGYQDRVDALRWNGRDIYDVRSASEDIALDGTKYQSW